MKNIYSNYNKQLFGFANYTVLIYLFFKGIFMPITTDEAYTFLNYVYVKDYFNVSIANNHLLNTLLISLTSKISNYELFLRLPNLIFAFIYIYFVNKLIKSSKKPFLSFCTFIMFPYVLELFSHARGYGIVFALNFCGLFYFFQNSSKNFKAYVVTCILFYFGALTLGYNLIVISTFFVFYVRKNSSILKNKYFLLFNSFIFIASLPLIRILILNTGNSRPVYGLPNDVSLFYFIKYFFGYSLLLNLNFDFVYLFISFLLFFLLLKKSYNHERDFKFMLILINLQLFLIPLIVNKPLPLLRLLMPFIPFLIFWIYYYLENLNIKTKINSFAIYTLFSLLLVNSISKFNIFYSLIWPSVSRKQIVSKALSNDSCEYLFDGGSGIVFEYYLVIYNILC